MTRKELEDFTYNGDCDRCGFGCCGECHIQCREIECEDDEILSRIDDVLYELAIDIETYRDIHNLPYPRDAWNFRLGYCESMLVHIIEDMYNNDIYMEESIKPFVIDAIREMIEMIETEERTIKRIYHLDRDDSISAWKTGILESRLEKLHADIYSHN